MNFKETDDVWRLYRREWVVVHTLGAVKAESGEASYRAGLDWVAANLAGRVRDTDVKVVLNTDNDGRFWSHVEVFKDNLKGEFKHVEGAQTHAQIHQYEEYVIVPRNSKSDHDIRQYGIVML